MARAPTSGTHPPFINNGTSLYDQNDKLFDPNLVRYDFTKTDETLWNKNFPYQLAVLKVKEAVGVDVSNPQATPVSYDIYNQLIFTLPVNPETLTHTMPFAISVTATLGGVVEQHGGAPFRTIQFAGTFGVVSDRPQSGDLHSSTLGGALGIAAGIFSGTVQATRNLMTSATSLGIGEKYKANLSNETPGNGDKDILPGSTGYFQFKALQRFLESYAEAKKSSGGRDLRLCLFIWKENAAYLVTPLAFDVTRSAASPYEYRYMLRFQAWRRLNPIDIGTTISVDATSQLASGANRAFSLATVFTAVSNAIRVAQAVTNVMRAVRRDIARVFDTMRQVALFCSALGGIPRTLLTLPGSIRRDFEEASRESWDIIQASFDGLDPNTKVQINQVTAEVASYNSGISTNTPTLQAILADDEQVDFHNLINPESLNPSTGVRTKFNNHVSQTLTLTSDDFRIAADTILSLIADYSDVVGLNSSTYDKVTGRTPKVKLRDAFLDDYRALHALATAAQAIQSLVINAPSRTPITTVEYVAGLANANGIAMRVPRSKFAVPFPYGSTLERLAQQYLGDATRWMEIAELNELSAPYVDEVGSSQTLLTNGSGNILNISDASTLTLGQHVRVWSNTVVPEKRRVLSIREITIAQWQVVLDGAADLSKLKTADVASIQWLMVGTVNSQQVIYIPSDSPANLDILKYVPQEQDFNRILTIGNVDGMLSDTGDLVITPDGYWPFVFGYSYLIQWARVALNTPIKSLALHPSFGIDVDIGQSLADSSAADILKSVRSVLRFNPTFTGVLSAQVARGGPTTQVSLELGIRGVDAVLPLTFDVQS